jgi:hypothetical protein
VAAAKSRIRQRLGFDAIKDKRENSKVNGFLRVRRPRALTGANKVCDVSFPPPPPPVAQPMSFTKYDPPTEVLPSVPRTDLPKDKGLKGGRCNRASCLKPNPRWRNRANGAFYCDKCARMLNEDPHNKREALALGGGPLCILET